jgi:hypothetical protein
MAATRILMSPLIEEALRAIESGSPDIVRDGFCTLAEVVAVNRIGNFHSDIPAANAEILEWAPLEEIQRAVQHWIEEHPDHPSVVSAFWVLDKFRDESLRPFLRHWLDHYVQRILPHLSPIGQILVDLDSLGEPSLSNHSFSANEHGKNLEDAIKYLRATGA